MVSEQQTNGSIAATRLLLQIDADRGLTPSATILRAAARLNAIQRAWTDLHVVVDSFGNFAKSREVAKSVAQKATKMSTPGGILHFAMQNAKGGAPEGGVFPRRD